VSVDSSPARLNGICSHQTRSMSSKFRLQPPQTHFLMYSETRERAYVVLFMLNESTELKQVWLFLNVAVAY